MTGAVQEFQRGDMMQAIYIWASLAPKMGPPILPRSTDDAAAALRRHRIMVIEDDAIVSLAMENLLADAGYLVLATCARGEEALRIAERQRPDLILADIKLAGTMDGIDTVASIFARYRVPVIFATAHTDAATRARMVALKPAEILAKPIPDSLLLNAIAAALRG